MDLTNILSSDDGEPRDVLISLSKLFGWIDYQIDYYDKKMKEHEENATEMYILGKPDEKYKDLMIKQEEWQWLKQQLVDKWPALLIN